MSKKVPVLSKQVKSLQLIIAVGCWAVGIERDQTNEKGLHALLEKLYMGDPNDTDIKPMHQSLFEGENRFGSLYEDAKYEKFSAFFGSLIGGHNKRPFKDLLDANTVKNKATPYNERKQKKNLTKIGIFVSSFPFSRSL